jgi:hypothetical protein
MERESVNEQASKPALTNFVKFKSFSLTWNGEKIDENQRARFEIVACGPRRRNPLQ